MSVCRMLQRRMFDKAAILLSAVPPAWHSGGGQSGPQLPFLDATQLLAASQGMEHRPLQLRRRAFAAVLQRMTATQTCRPPCIAAS